MFEAGEDGGSFAAHHAGVVFHDAEVCANEFGQVGFVDDEEVRLGDAGAAFAGDFVACGDVDDVDGVVDEFFAEVGGEVVTTAFDQEEVDVVVKADHEVFEGVEVEGDVFANGGVWAAAGFNANDAVGFEGFVAQ